MIFENGRRVVACLAVLAATGASITALSEAQPTYRETRPAISQPSALYVGAVASDAELAELEALIQNANDIVRSELFEKNFLAVGAGFPALHAGSSPESLSPKQAIDLLLLRAPGALQPRTAVALVGGEAYGGGDFNYTARTGTTGAFPDQVSGMSMSIGRVTMYRYRQWNAASPNRGDIVDHSCAINTMAHELSHTIKRDPLRLAFLDTAMRTDKTNPPVSYLIGTVAQCTYLQMRGRINEGELQACVSVFGTHNFNNGRCNHFANGQKVELRDGLPPAAPPL